MTMREDEAVNRCQNICQHRQPTLELDSICDLGQRLIYLDVSTMVPHLIGYRARRLRKTPLAINGVKKERVPIDGKDAEKEYPA
jgi:hypothetical protein